MIRVNHTLQVLNISENQVGDVGVAAIAGALPYATVLELNMSMCSITITGAKALAAGLLSNHIIRILNVESNDITVEGSVAILEAAIMNKICEEVWINYKYESTDKVKEIMTILKARKRQS